MAAAPVSPRHLDRVFSDDRVNRRRPEGSGGRLPPKLQAGHAANHLISYSLSEMNMVGLAPTAVEEQMSSYGHHAAAATSSSASFHHTPRRVIRNGGVGGGSSSSNRPSASFLAPTGNSYLSLVAVSTSATIANKFKPFLVKVWGGLLLLEKDPDPTVSLLARNLLDIVWKRMCEKERSAGVDMFRGHSAADVHSSQSAPSSPMRPCFILGESPPVSSALNLTLPAGLGGGHHHHQELGGPASLGHSSFLMRSTVSTIGEEGILLEEGESTNISTQFIDWAARFAPVLFQLVVFLLVQAR